jgi:hypothetical protein
MWSMDWYSLLHLHFASSLRWNRCKYAFVIPCPVSTAVIFGVSYILDLSLSWTVGKYCLVAAAFWLVVHSRCCATQKDPVPIVQEAGWAPWPVLMGMENLPPIGIQSLDRPAHGELLYWLSYPSVLVCVLTKLVYKVRAVSQWQFVPYFQNMLLILMLSSRYTDDTSSY